MLLPESLQERSLDADPGVSPKYIAPTPEKKMNFKTIFRGQRDNIADMVLALHITNPCLIPGIPYGF